MDRLQAMQTFVRVVEAGSFSAVAKQAATTQSAISKQVAALERTLGTRLLSRTTRSLSLTDDGERYFEQVRRLVAEIAEAEETVRGGDLRLQGWLRVAAPVAFGRLKILPVVQDFLRQHPGVKIDLKLHDGLIDLVEQGIDVAVRIGVLADSSLVSRRIGTTRRAAVATRQYLGRLPKDVRRPRSPGDLLQHDCIVYTELPSPNDWAFTAGPGAAAEVGSRQTVRVQGSLQTNSSEVVRAGVLAGMGIGYSPLWLFDAELAAGKLEVLLPEWTATDLPVQLVSPSQRRHSTKAKAFGDAAAKILG